MAALTKLTDAEVQVIADRILGERWRDSGYHHAEVSSEDDVYGEPALSVTVWLQAASPVLPVDLYIAAALAMRDAIRAEGEQRYAYLHLRRPDDLIIEDDDADAP